MSGPIARTVGLALMVALSLVGRPSDVCADGVVLTLRQLDRTGATVATTDYTMPQLEALGLAEVVTSTPWTQGKIAFQGVPLVKLIGGASRAGELKAIALNDYSASLPLDDAGRFGVILATRMSGKPMAVKDKGPLWIVYPLDGFPELNNQRVHARMVWQVRFLEFQ